MTYASLHMLQLTIERVDNIDRARLHKDLLYRFVHYRDREGQPREPHAHAPLVGRSTGKTAKSTGSHRQITKGRRTPNVPKPTLGWPP